MNLLRRLPFAIALALAFATAGEARAGDVPLGAPSGLLPPKLTRALQPDPFGPLLAQATPGANPGSSAAANPGNSANPANPANPDDASSDVVIEQKKEEPTKGFLIYVEKKGPVGFQHVIPFYFHWWDQPRKVDNTLVFPYYQHHDARGSFHMFFPLVYSLADTKAQSRTTWIFPIAGWHTSPTTGAGYFATAYGYHGPSGWAGGLAPLFFAGNLNGHWHGVLFPIFFGAGDERGSTYVLGPGYYKRRTDKDPAGEGWDAGLFPLFFAARHKDHSYVHVAGLFTRVADANGQTVVVGPVYGSSRKDGYAYGLAPLLNFSRSGTRTTQWLIPPLYIHSSDSADDTQFTMIGPAFRARTAPGERTQGVFPLLWDVDRGPSHTQVGFPLYVHSRNDETKRESWQIGPYVRVRDEARQRLTQVLFPLFVKFDSPDYNATVQFPFFWRVRDKDETDTVLFPLYGRARKPGYAADVAFPLFWRFAGNDWNTTVVGPAYYHRKGGSLDAGFAPLFGWGHRPQPGGGVGSYQWITPLAYHDAFGDKAHTWIFNFYQSHEGHDWTSMFLPVYAGWRRGASAHVIGIPFYYSRDDVDKTGFLLAGPLYRGRSAHHYYGGLFPVLWLNKYDDGAGNATFFPLFHWANKADGGHRLITLLGGFSTSGSGDTKVVFGPTYFHTHDGSLRHMFLPLPIFYYGRNPEAKTTSAVWFPFFLHTSGPETSLTAITPLYWRYRTVDSVTDVALLFFHHHDYYKSRSFGLLPVFFHSHDYTTDEHVNQFLVYYQRVAPNETDRVFFPLYWHWQRGADTTNVVAPIYWAWRRGTDTTTIVAPLGAGWHRDDGDRWIVLNTYYRKGKGVDEGTWSFHFFPLFNVGVPHKGSFEWGILGGAITVLRNEQGKTLRLFWNFDVVLSTNKPKAKARAAVPVIF